MKISDFIVLQVKKGMDKHAHVCAVCETPLKDASFIVLHHETTREFVNNANVVSRGINSAIVIDCQTCHNEILMEVAMQLPKELYDELPIVEDEEKEPSDSRVKREPISKDEIIDVHDWLKKQESIDFRKLFKQNE